MISPPARASLAVLVMIIATFAAHLLTPKQKLSEQDPIDLQSTIPAEFGDWGQDAVNPRVVVNPQQADLISKLYSQLITRSYVNRKTGTRVMLSIAYGADQRDSTQMHYPEVCYPAQGFVLKTNEKGVLRLRVGDIRVRRLQTELGAERHEPVTYWTMIGYRPVLGGVEKKIAEMRYGLTGMVPDGLLFRISTIDDDPASAFATQQAFANDLLGALPARSRHRLAGI
ncbi:exosortase-associated protein EpsI, B-type [Niveibacterium sp.]|uniref:exosortase-associated protein EpsI, B-type n=1 Tax=Niveibacterium sp. TaxID=2017444 RepID=UPI0035B452DB